jgi:hypothetical protein
MTDHSLVDDFNANSHYVSPIICMIQSSPLLTFLFLSIRSSLEQIVTRSISVLVCRRNEMPANGQLHCEKVSIILMLPFQVAGSNAPRAAKSWLSAVNSFDSAV